jgi:hypothetical protein
MALPNKIVADAIDTAPLNRGLKGVDWLAVPGNIAITSDKGDVTLFDDEGEGIYEIHVLYVSRGKEALAEAKRAIQAMFEERGASLIYAMVPVIRPDVKLLARWAGMRSVGLRWGTEDHFTPALFELFVLSKFQWKVARS